MRYKYILFTFFSFFVLNSFAAININVSNVRFQQQNTEIYIYYDLYCDLLKEYKISLKLSDNSGMTFDITPKSLKGDVGKGIYPGQNKEIIWEFLMKK